MTIYLKKIKEYKIIFLILILIQFFLYNHVSSSENKIIFKINERAFTSFDLEKRLEYLSFVGNDLNIEKKIIIEDFISANLFYEYYKNLENKYNYQLEINNIYGEILSTNNKNNKKFNFKINKENILDNIKIDYLRKVILENILNSSINNIKTSKEEIDLLYNIKIQYINFEINDVNKLKNEISSLEYINFENIKLYLKEKNINYFTKEKEINNINNIDKRLKEKILLNNDFFIIEKKNKISLVFVKKNFETLDGIIANLYSVRSVNELSNEFLNCKNLINLNDNINIINKEYRLIDLNNDLKNNLVKINDYVKYVNDEQNVYIVLCNIKFDKEILNNINFNKIINLNVSKIEKKFINKYSKIYNLNKFYE